ncbi:hypothetical protein ABQE62_07185 [Mycolicibacterium fortuitum]
MPKTVRADRVSNAQEMATAFNGGETGLTIGGVLTHPLNCEKAKQGACHCRCVGTGHGLARLREVRNAESQAALIGKRDPYLHEHRRLRQEREIAIAENDRERTKELAARKHKPRKDWSPLKKQIYATSQQDRRVLHELALADLAVYLYGQRLDTHTDSQSPNLQDTANTVGAHAVPQQARDPGGQVPPKQALQPAEAAADVLANVELLAEIFSSQVPDLLQNHLGNNKKERESKRKALSETHFWCSLLAGLAKALDFISDPWAEISGKAREFVINYIWERMPRRGKRGIVEWLQRQLLTMLVNSAWKVIERAATAGLSLPDFHQAIRVLGVISCPDLDVHPDVVEYCLVPLIKDFADTDVRQYIIAELCIAYPALEDALRRYSLNVDAN